jgi:hypothetical protein
MTLETGVNCCLRLDNCVVLRAKSMRKQRLYNNIQNKLQSYTDRSTALTR